MALRLRELDFLRGVAIILVLCSHQFITKYISQMGWIGVDLFFVLSGFLVSGLLFNELKKDNSIDPLRFLIRRGFKIYPLYYLVYSLYLFDILKPDKWRPIGFLADMTFTQNYVWGWGYAFVPSWSLAVEEHFYFLLVIVFWLLAGKAFIQNSTLSSPSKLGKFEFGVIGLMGLVLLLRIFNNLYFPHLKSLNYTMHT